MYIRKLLSFCIFTLLLSCATKSKTTTTPLIYSLVSLDEALINAAAEVNSKVQGKTEIAVFGIKAPSSDIEDFLTEELNLHLVNSGKFNVVARDKVSLAVLDTEHQFQMSGLVSDESAVGIGHYLGAKVVITGTFSRYANFNYLRLRALDVRTAQILAVYPIRIKPDDIVLASLVQPLDKPIVITENALENLNLGEDLFREGKYDEAIRELDRALALNKNLFNAYFYRACIFYYKGDFDRAIADFSSTFSLNTDYYEALNNRGAAYSNKGDHNRAIADYTAALRIKPDYYDALMNRGGAYIEWKGDYNMAILDFTSALKIIPESLMALEWRGMSYTEIGDYDRAVADWEAILRINPNDTKAKIFIEVIRFTRGY